MKIRCLVCGGVIVVEAGAQERARTCPNCRGEPPAQRAAGAAASARTGTSSVLVATKPVEIAEPQLLGDVIAAGDTSVKHDDESGDRVIRATRVAQRYGLSMGLAYLVGDTKITLAEALRLKAEADALIAQRRAVWTFWIGWGGAIVAVLFGVIGAAIWTGIGINTGTVGRADLVRVGRAAPAPSVRTSSEVRTDPEGRITGIRALDPESVLASYCQSLKAGARPVPVRISSTAEGDRLGVFNQGGKLRAIRIRKEEGSVYWVAGNGKDPIEPEAPGAASHTPEPPKLSG